MSDRTASIARGWIEAWQRMDMAWLRAHLSPDFVHESPFGVLKGRDHYLAVVEPMARKSVLDLTIRHVLAGADQAAIWFENRTPEGPVATCDWVRVAGDQIVAVRSFYDTGSVREVLSAEEQARLEGGSA